MQLNSLTNQLYSIAEALREQLGHSYYVRPNYRFAVPQEERLLERSADAVIFSSPIPSMQTAVVGFSSLSDQRDDNISEEQLSSFAYLGAPLLVTSSDRSLSLYQFTGSPVAEKIDEISPLITSPEAWVRDRLLDHVEAPQSSLALAAGRGLLIQQAQFALSASVSTLMNLISEEKRLCEVDSFRIAMATIRSVFLGTEEHPYLGVETLPYVQDLAARFQEAISFANIPPESVAELYERLAVEAGAKRRLGVVYTPAWLARFVINRLPVDAFRSGRAMDPTCGSGTFLVCFLERLIEEQARSGVQPSTTTLQNAITGIDIDPVAIETARLSLDLFCKAIGVQSPKWDLSVRDAAMTPIEGEWIVGNLPFGYRTYEGKRDLSSVIFENIETTNKRGRGLSLILPDSLAYTNVARKARELLRSNYRIQEITRLPEAAFETSAVQTMVVVGRKGKPAREAVVREVGPEDLSSFRSGAYVSRNYVSRLPAAIQDPWRFSPFNNAFERAEKRGVALRDVARIHVGLQIYGTETSVLSVEPQQQPRPLLTNTTTFSAWTERSVWSLPNLIGQRHEVRRQGPWDLFSRPKVIVRVTTVPGSYDRLAAIADTQGVWFTDKFAGIWPETAGIDSSAIAAYLQTRFARAWFDTNNPSRKLRVRTIGLLPLPKIPADWWKRASALVELSTVIRPLLQQDDLKLLFDDINAQEWDWFNSVVESALGLDPSVGAALKTWFRSN